MPRETLDRKIQHLRDEIIVMNSMVESALMDSINALRNRDSNAARRTYAADEAINAKRYELEKDTISTIATQQPIMAGDLRLLASILEVAAELERMGDYAKGIAKICLLLDDDPFVKPLVDIPIMAELTTSMLHRAVDAFITLDVVQAKKIPLEDDQIDHLYYQVYRELVSLIFTDPSAVDRANYQMWVAHNLERLADRVTNICERTIYVATGVMEEFLTTNDERVYLE